MLFLKNLLLRNFQGCCLLFNYQGSSLFFLRSSSNILSCRFFFVKNFFIFLFRCLFQKHSSPQVSLYRLSHPLPIVKNFFSSGTVVCSRTLSPYDLAAGSFLWSASATSGILSRADGIVNNFLIFSLIQTIPCCNFIFQSDFIPDQSHH